MLLSAMTLFTSCTEMAKKLAMKALDESAEFEKEDTVKWGNVVEQELDLTAFTTIDAKGAVRIVFTQDSTFAVRVRGNEKCLEKYKFEVRNDELNVEPKDYNGSVKRSSPAVTLFISAPVLSEVEIAGAGKLELLGTIVLPNKLDIDMAGAGDITIDDLTVEEMNIDMNGAGKCTLAKVTATGDIAWLREAAAERAALQSRSWSGLSTSRVQVPKLGSFPLSSSNTFSKFTTAKEWVNGNLETNIVVGYNWVTNRGSGVDKVRIAPSSSIDISSGLSFGSGFSGYLPADSNVWLQSSQAIGGDNISWNPPGHTNIITNVTTSYPSYYWGDNGFTYNTGMPGSFLKRSNRVTIPPS